VSCIDRRRLPWPVHHRLQDDLAQDFPRAVADYESRLRAGDKTGGTFPWMATRSA